MTVYNVLCFFAAAAVFIALINHKINGPQTSIAITAGAVILSLLLVLAGQLAWLPLEAVAIKVVNEIDFESFLLQGILGFLLFAGGLGIKLSNMQDQKWEITLLALVATLSSTFIIGSGLYLVCQLVNFPLQYIYCLLFGALISPTDPIAVLAIVKKLQAPQRISTQIEGESLFNDGFGLVIFVTIFSIAFGQQQPDVGSVLGLFLREAIGGMLYGLLLSMLFHWLIAHTDDAAMEQLLTLLIPSAGYVLAELLTVSGPLAMVVAGIFIGNITYPRHFTQESQQHLRHFWELVDELLNGILFLLIGLAMLTFAFHWQDWVLMVLAIPLVLAGRYLSVKLCYLGFQQVRRYNAMSVTILTWGGLRGGLAIAMAMSVPAGVMIVPDKHIDVKEILLVMTYSVVLFSILIQGSTITPLIEKAKRLDSSG
ncbi:sodium:proton antiporter [Shewanella sp. NFH-SH190041]|uniref:cation:proton antiporter n=1 Tax=Shewanella sp. NFH-SH190041 TaxID=2950245 RepID=UPI0021C2D0AE|nr:sodium:proton antiporter [Shewanella sp. NFH-SH190041]BDM64347.1 sodium:proton antiporter [Shewanella sp. NFH-SH190041]